MAIDESGSQVFDRGHAQRVSLSKWVNERFPSFQELLTAHDVARLTRRHRLVLAALTLIGRFPRRQRFRGRRIGWLRSDVLNWLADDIGLVSCYAAARSRPTRMAGRQMCLPLEGSATCHARRRRQPCSRKRAGV
jgi:predicted DNA-binding transcriptional regulator AlpA